MYRGDIPTITITVEEYKHLRECEDKCKSVRSRTMKSLEDACKTIQRYCDKHEDCIERCIFYHNGCMLYGTPDTWNITLINAREKEQKK